MMDYSIYVLIFVAVRDSLMSFVGENSFSLVRNNLSERVWMYHTRHVLCSVRLPYPPSLWNKKGLSILRGSEAWSGQTIV